MNLSAATKMHVYSIIKITNLPAALFHSTRSAAAAASIPTPLTVEGEEMSGMGLRRGIRTFW